MFLHYKRKFKNKYFTAEKMYPFCEKGKLIKHLVNIPYIK